MYNNGERMMAWIDKIVEVNAIAGADKIVSYKVGGWNVVDQRDRYSVGDLVVYLSIDSWVPTEIAPFLTKGSEPRVYNGVRGEKLRTIKLRGSLSQGLILPLGVLGDALGEPTIGEDATGRLGIQKWEPTIPAEMAGQAAGLFPSFIKKTDQERIQNLASSVFGYDDVVHLIPGLTPEVAARDNALGIAEGRIIIKDDGVYSVKVAEASPHDQYEVSMKLDGSSMTVFARALFTEPFVDEDGITQNPIEVGVCSRNMQLKINEENAGNVFVKTAVESGILPALEDLAQSGKQYAVQGELMGEGIQGNQECIRGKHMFFVFDIYDIVDNRYLSPTERMEVFDRLVALGADIQHVPVLHGPITLGELGITNVETALAFAEGPSYNPAVQREGLVFKRHGRERFSWKAISNKWLLAEK